MGRAKPETWEAIARRDPDRLPWYGHATGCEDGALNGHDRRKGLQAFSKPHSQVSHDSWLREIAALNANIDLAREDRARRVRELLEQSRPGIWSARDCMRRFKEEVSGFAPKHSHDGNGRP